MSRRAWWWYLGAGAVLVAAHVGVPPGLGRDLFGLAISLTALVAIGLGLRAYRPVTNVPWILIGAGSGMWMLGDLFWAILDWRGLDPFPSVADGVYLVGYVVLAAGLYRLSRSRSPHRDARAVLDALIVGAVVTLVLTVLFIEPAWEAEDTLLARLVGAAYPVGDVMLLVQITHLRTAGRGKSPALRMLTFGLAVTMVADLLFQAAAYLPALDERIHLLDPGWILGYLLFGAAALHPSMASATAEQRWSLEPMSLTRRQLLLITGCVAVLPGVTALEVALEAEPHLVATGVASMVVIWLLYLRMHGMAREMTRQAQRLAGLADADVLTGLANLRRFSDEVTDCLLDERVPEVPVLLVVLDRFTEINDTLGHRVGDELLCAVADRLRRIVGTKGVVGRVGGDTFGIVIEDAAACEHDATDCAATLRSELVAPFELSDVTVSVDALIGVAIGPEDGDTVGELMQRADVAISVARDRSDGVARYTGRMPFDTVFNPHIVGELSQALAAGDIVVHYQPKVHVATGQVLGVEALVRWQHPVHGLLPPSAFIPAAERTGLIRPLTLYVLERALEQVAAWRAAGRALSVSVNLSVRDLLDPGFVSEVAEAVRRNGVPQDALELEITETMAMVDPARSLSVLEGLSALGVLLSVDDYGTGYSSLAYLQRLPVRRLKIDRQFVMGVVEDRASAAIVRSTIELARHLGMTVVAEGVEDDATLLSLRDMGCDAAQGFGLGRPVAPDALLPLVDVIEERVPRVLVQMVPVGRRIV